MTVKPLLNFMLVVSLCIAGIVAWQHADAQSYPVKPVRLIIPYPPGGGVDTIMRPFAQHLAARLGQQIIIDNRGGGGGSIGMEAVARATPDGHVIVAAINAQLAINPALYKSLPYDPLKDFAPITWFADGAYILVVHPALPVKSVKELIELARKRPNEITYSSAGNGSGGHLAGGLLCTMAGIKMLHIPYKGGGPARIGLLSGENQMTFETWASGGSFIKDGRLRALGVATATRRKASPDIPTIAEAGVPGYESGLWYALLAPAATPRAIIDRLNRETIAVLNTPEYSKVLADQGIEPVGSTPEELTQYIRRELDKWAKVVKDTGVHID